MNGERTPTTLPVREIQTSITRTVEELALFISILQKRFASQLPHSVFSNNALVGSENIPKHTVRLAIISAIGEYLNWEVEEVARFAAATLEDSNVHYLSKFIHEQLDNHSTNEEWEDV